LKQNQKDNLNENGVKNDPEEEKRRVAELSLMFEDDNDDVNQEGYNMREVQQQYRQDSQKVKKRNKGKKEDKR